jgi:hypothetical protein
MPAGCVATRAVRSHAVNGNAIDIENWQRQKLAINFATQRKASFPPSRRLPLE